MPGAPRATLVLSALEERPTRVGVTLGPTLLSVLETTAGGHTPDAWCRLVRSALDPHDFAVLAPTVTPVRRYVPECVLPFSGDPPMTAQEEIDRVASTTPDELFGQLCREGPGVTGLWRDVASDPKRWLRRYVSVLARSFAAIEKEWIAAAPQFEREMERVGTAVVRGTVQELISGISPSHAIRNGTLDFPRANGCAESLQLRLPPAGLTLLPRLVGPPYRLLRRFDGDTFTHLDYLAPRATPAGDRPIHAASLEALIGSQRALLLRHLDGREHMRAIAHRLQTVPSAATHHVAALAAAGLVSRERRGRHIFVFRTARGTDVLRLYER